MAGDIGKGQVAIAIVDVFALRGAEGRFANLRKSLTNDDEPVRIGVRWTLQEDGVDDAEDGGVDADAEREIDDRDRDEGRILPRAPKRITNVAQAHFQQRKRATLARGLLRAFQTAEFQERETAGLADVDAAPDQVVHVQREMTLELGLEVRVGVRSKDGGDEPGHPGSQAGHHRGSCGARKRARMAVA